MSDRTHPAGRTGVSVAPAPGISPGPDATILRAGPLAQRKREANAMASPLLATKLHIPRPRPDLVARPALTERLDEGLRLGRRLTLVSAPAGFGKTTLIGAWVAGSEQAAAWVSLDEGDNDPVQFLNYLIAALRTVGESIGHTTQALLQSPQIPPLPGLITPLINDIAALDAPLTLVLDDYHHITAGPVHQALRFLLENQPPWLHLAICTREDPPLPLAQLRARGQLTEVRERDLRFTPEEAAAFLNVTMGLPLDARSVAALEARTEGWIAGLQLAALALQEASEDAGAFIAAFTGDNRYIMDYLIEEVLQRQPETVREFLRQTAILDRLTAPLCDALTGREDSRAILDQLDAANLFLIPLDHRREWYRYHQLFADVLRVTLGPAERRPLHQRAARWFEAQGLAVPAIHHALASGDQDAAERLIALAAEATFHEGGVMTVRAWLDALPSERVRVNGSLAALQGWVLALSGQMAEAWAYADAAEAGLREDGAPADELGKLLALRGFVALLGQRDTDTAMACAAEALAGLGEDQLQWRTIALWVQAEALEQTGRIAQAVDTFFEARRVGLALGRQVFVSTVEMSLALALNYRGQRREAVAFCEEAIERYLEDETGRMAPAAAPIFGRLATLCYEANDLDQASLYAGRSIALSEQMGWQPYPAVARGLAAPIQHALGDTGAALEALRKAYRVMSQTSLGDADWYLALEAGIRLQQGDLAHVVQWAEAAGLSPDGEPEYLRLEHGLVYARLLLAQNRPEEAGRWLARLEAYTAERGLNRALLSVHILQALANDRLGDAQTARERLAQALVIAAPEDYHRAFLDEDPRVIALLPDLRQRAPAFVAQLLEYAGVPDPRRAAAAQPLVEPLSERELEVLDLIAAGLSNNEIAGRLTIAIGTVKRHINNLYGKLEVRSRTEAVAKARALRLLD